MIGEVVYTLGTSYRTPDEFLALLKEVGVEVVMDVLRFPTSRFKYFEKDELSRLLEREGFSYIYLGEEPGDIEGRDTRLMSALRSLGGGIAGLKSWPVRGVWSFSVPSAFLSCAVEDLLAGSWSGMDSKSLMSSMKRVCGCPGGRLMGMVERQGFIFYVELHAIV